MRTAGACLIAAASAFLLTKVFLSRSPHQSVPVSSGAAHHVRSPQPISDSTLTSSTWLPLPKEERHWASGPLNIDDLAHDVVERSGFRSQNDLRAFIRRDPEKFDATRDAVYILTKMPVKELRGCYSEQNRRGPATLDIEHRLRARETTLRIDQFAIRAAFGEKADIAAAQLCFERIFGNLTLERNADLNTFVAYDGVFPISIPVAMSHQRRH
jgi:hypothetical protein